MSNIDDPTYVIDFRSSKNRDKIENAEPGQEISILIKLENETEIEPIEAKAKRSEDGLTFEVFLTASSGVQSLKWSWGLLQDALKYHS